MSGIFAGVSGRIGNTPENTVGVFITVQTQNGATFGQVGGSGNSGGNGWVAKAGALALLVGSNESGKSIFAQGEGYYYPVQGNKLGTPVKAIIAAHIFQQPGADPSAGTVELTITSEAGELLLETGLLPLQKGSIQTGEI